MYTSVGDKILMYVDLQETKLSLNIALKYF